MFPVFLQFKILALLERMLTPSVLVYSQFTPVLTFEESSSGVFSSETPYSDFSLSQFLFISDFKYSSIFLYPSGTDFCLI